MCTRKKDVEKLSCGFEEEFKSAYFDDQYRLFFSSKQGLLKVRGWGRIEVCAICIDRKGAIHKKKIIASLFLKFL